MAILKLRSEGSKKFLILNFLLMYFRHLNLIFFIENGVKFIIQSINSGKHASKIIDRSLKFFYFKFLKNFQNFFFKTFI